MEKKLTMKTKFCLLMLLWLPFGLFAQSEWSAPFKSEQAFLENQGQFDALVPEADILYGIDHGFGWQVMMDKSGAYLISRKFNRVKKTSQMDTRGFAESTLIRQEWLGSNPNVSIQAIHPRTDYFTYSYQVGEQFRSLDHVPGFGGLKYENLYPGIDLEYMAPEEGGIKYSLNLSAGADHRLIRLAYHGSTPSLKVDGSIQLPTVLGNITDHAPIARYLDGNQENIPCAFGLNGNEITFILGEYDTNRPIQIDPWTVNPAFPLFNRAFEVDVDAAGNVYAWGGGMGYNLKKYNSAGALQWTHVSPWDTSNAWFGELLVMPAGDVFITSGSPAKIRRLTTAGATTFTNNGPFFNVDEYWAMTLNCDNTKLLVGGSRIIGLTSPQGHVFNLNLGSGAQLAGSPINIAPTGMNEVRAINRSGANGYIYAISNNNLICLDNNLGQVFNIANGYSMPYYSPAYMANSVQGVNAVDGNASAVYTSNGATLERRNPSTGAILGNVAIPNGSFTSGFFGSGATNSGLALDACGNVYVGSRSQVVKYNGTLTQLATVATTGAVYDLVVAPGNTIIWGGDGFVTSNTSLAACSQMTYSCTLLPVEIAYFETSCENSTPSLNWSITKPIPGYTAWLEHSQNGSIWAKDRDLVIETDLQWQTPLDNADWFYRIAFEDANGMINYSPVASFEGCGESTPALQAIPTVTTTHTNLVANQALSGDFSVSVVNSQGKTVKTIELSLDGAYTAKVPLDGLTSGMYFVRLTALEGNYSSTVKVVKR